MSTEPGNALNPDLMGYTSVEALVAAKRSSDAEAKRLADENAANQTLLRQVVESGILNGRQSVPERRASSAEERLTGMGVPVDALGEYVAAQVQDGVMKALAPITNGLQARTRFVAEHPDYVQFENEVSQFIATDPGLSRAYPKMFEADPAEAMTYAFLKFGDARRRTVPAPNGDGPSATDAAIPSSRTGEGRREPDADAQRQELLTKLRSTGSREDIMAYAKFRLGQSIPEAHLRQ